MKAKSIGLTLKLKRISGLLCLSLTLGACTNLSGIGSSEFNCAAPVGVSCNSISGTNSNLEAGNLRDGGLHGGQESGSGKPSGVVKSYFDDGQGQVNRPTLSTGMPIRIQPKEARVWIAPWEDRDGFLHDQSYSYIIVGEGRWSIDANKQKLIDDYRPSKTTYLLKNGAPSTNNKAASGGVVETEKGNTNPVLPVVPKSNFALPPLPPPKP